MIDYKTDTVEGERQIGERAEHYKPQITAYCAAVSKMFGTRHVTGTVMFVGSGEMVSVCGQRV